MSRQVRMPLCRSVGVRGGLGKASSSSRMAHQRPSPPTPSPGPGPQSSAAPVKGQGQDSIPTPIPQHNNSTTRKPPPRYEDSVPPNPGSLLSGVSDGFEAQMMRYWKDARAKEVPKSQDQVGGGGGDGDTLIGQLVMKIPKEALKVEPDRLMEEEELPDSAFEFLDSEEQKQMLEVVQRTITRGLISEMPFIGTGPLYKYGGRVSPHIKELEAISAFRANVQKSRCLKIVAPAVKGRIPRAPHPALSADYARLSKYMDDKTREAVMAEGARFATEVMHMASKNLNLAPGGGHVFEFESKDMVIRLESNKIDITHYPASSSPCGGRK